MTNRHIERVIEWTQRVDNEGSECDGIGEALDLFRVLRYINPMGKLREAALRSHWSCRYPDGDLLGEGSGSNSGETLVVEKEVVKDVPVEVVVEKEVVREVETPGETVVGNDVDSCATVERWIPPSWIPAEERP